jgi:hypothetical protein
MEAVPMTIEGEGEKDFFLWVSHGMTTEDYNRLYPYKSQFPTLQLYIEHSKILYFDTSMCPIIQGIQSECLTNFLLNPHTIINGTKKNNNYELFIPPLLFESTIKDPESQKEFMGLYHFKLLNNSLNLIDKIKDWNFIYNESGLNNTYITYSKIEGYVKSYVKLYNEMENEPFTSTGANKIDINNSILGIFSCRELADYSIEKPLSGRQQKIYEKRIVAPINITKPANFNELAQQDLNENICLDLLSFLLNEKGINAIFNKLNTWSGALAKLKHQGCGINVLDFFVNLGLGEEEQRRIEQGLRSMAVCLPATGSSIFSFLDMFIEYNKIINNIDLMQNRFIVFRFPKINAIHFLSDYLSYIGVKYAWIPIKLYRNLNVGSKFDEVGHFVGLLKYENELKLIDPQASIYENVEYLNHNFYSEFNYIDLIFGEIEIENCNIQLNLILQYGGIVHPRPLDLTWGGEGSITNFMTEMKEMNVPLKKEDIPISIRKELEGVRSGGKRKTKKRMRKRTRKTRKH